MPNIPAASTHGTTIAFAGSAFDAEITSISMSSERQSTETTHLNQTANAADEFGGATHVHHTISTVSFDIEGNFNIGQTGSDEQPPISGLSSADAIQANETITITFPTFSGASTGASWAFSGFFTSFSVEMPLADKFSFSGTVQVTGVVTVTPAAV